MKNSHHTKFKISTKVALSFIAIVLFQGILTQVVTYSLISRSNEESFRNRMYVNMEGVENYLSQVVYDLDNKVGLLSGQKNIIEYSEYRLRNLLSRELSLFNTALDMNGIFIVIDGGRMLAADSPERHLSDDILTTIVTRGYRQGRQSFMHDDGTGMYLYSLGQIVRNDLVIGMAVARIAIDEEFIQRLEKITSSTALIQFPEREITTAEVSAELLQTVIAAAASMRPGDIDTVGDYFIGSISLESLGTISGRLVSILDMRESKRTMHSYNSNAFLLTLIVLIIALVLSILFYRQSFLRPYMALQEGVARIGNGDFSYPIQQTSGDEFGDLVESVNTMRSNLETRDRELKAMVNFNQLILNNVKSGIITVGLDGYINSCNAAARGMIHLDTLDLLPLELEKAGVPSDIKDQINIGLKSGEFVTLKECRLMHEGQNVILTLSTSPFFDGKGAELGIIAVMADVTKIRTLEEQLQVSQRLAAIGEMVAGVSHQLRNPLAIMKVSAELLRDNFVEKIQADQTQYSELTEMLVSEIDSLNYIIHNFLDFARPLHIIRSVCSVESIVRNAVSLIPGDSFRGIDFQIEIPEDLPRFNLDKEMMEQVVRNLVQNAIEACRGSGQVTASASVEKDMLQLKIADTGCGMDDQSVQSIFNPFYTEKESGTGLGLAIVQRIILEHKGTIGVESQPGEGSVFTIFI